MRKVHYRLCALIATIEFMLPATATLYAQPADTPIAAVDDAPEALTVPENADSALPEASAAAASSIEVAKAKEAADLTPADQAAEDPIGTAGEVISDVRAGDWRHAAAGFLVLVMLGLAKARKETDWFSGDRAGAGLVIGLGLVGGLVTTLYADGPLDWKLFLGSTSVVTSAVGIYTLAKKLFFPGDKAKE